MKPTVRDVENRVEKLVAIVEELKDVCAEYLGHEDAYARGWEALEGGLYSLTSDVKVFKQETAAMNDDLFTYTSWTEDEEEELR